MIDKPEIKKVEECLNYLDNDEMTLFRGSNQFTFEYPILILDDVPFRAIIIRFGRNADEAKESIDPIKNIKDINGDAIDIAKFQLVRWIQFV